jgi:hypothetical protein
MTLKDDLLGRVLEPRCGGAMHRGSGSSWRATGC